MGKWLGRGIALVYLLALLIVPVGIVFSRTFQHGFGPFWDAITAPDASVTLPTMVAVTA